MRYIAYDGKLREFNLKTKNKEAKSEKIKKKKSKKSKKMSETKNEVPIKKFYNQTNN